MQQTNTNINKWNVENKINNINIIIYTRRMISQYAKIWAK